jgi:hypothetical protein
MEKNDEGLQSRSRFEKRASSEYKTCVIVWNNVLGWVISVEKMELIKVPIRRHYMPYVCASENYR